MPDSIPGFFTLLRADQAYVSEKERNFGYFGAMKKTNSFLSARKTIGLLIAIGALAACSSASENPVQDAVAAMEQQDYRSARIHLMTALRENSQDPKANLLFARTMIELGDGLGAEAALKKISGNAAYQVQVRPLIGKAMLLKGNNEAALEIAAEPSGDFAAELSAVKTMALFGLGRIEEADAALASGLGGTPNNAELLWIKGNRALEIGDLDTATQSSELALKQKPDSLEVLMLAGRLSLAKADGASALSYFEKIREVRPDNMASEYLRGALLKDFGKRKEARNSFEAVLSASPTHPWATYFLAQMDYEDGKSDKAFDRLLNTKADIGEVPPALRLFGILDGRRGNFEQAIEKLNRYLAQNPADAETLVALADALSAAGNDAQAYDAIAPVARSVTAPDSALQLAAKLGAKSGSSSVQNYAARAAELKSDPAKNEIFEAEQAIIGRQWIKAEAIYKKLLAKPHPQKVMVLNNAAMVQLKLAKADEAIKFAKQARELAPDDPMVMDTLGWILLQSRKDKAGALALLQKANSAVPGNPEFRWHLANALAANGKMDEARNVAVSLQPIAQGDQKRQIDNLLTWI